MEKFKKNGLEKRIKIYERSEFSNVKDHLDFYKYIDIALDTFPYNGVTTTFEALWMGVPVIGIKGYNFNSRCGESILKNANLNSLISKDQNDYVKKAITFSTNLERLSEINKNLRQIALESPLFNSSLFAKQLNSALWKMWKNFILKK